MNSRTRRTLGALLTAAALLTLAYRALTFTPQAATVDGLLLGALIALGFGAYYAGTSRA